MSPLDSQSAGVSSELPESRQLSVLISLFFFLLVTFVSPIKYSQ